MMRRSCAWCGKELGGPASDRQADQIISHGLCERCAHHLHAQMGLPLLEYLDGLGAPIVVVDADVTVRMANQRACALLKRDLSMVQGKKGGEVFECAYALLPGGCGYTMHCSGCAIRRAVTETYRTGRSCLRVPACLHPDTPGAEREVELLISTEKVGEVVLLRIDEVDGERL
jgi:PAS domain-containing protein